MKLILLIVVISLVACLDANPRVRRGCGDGLGGARDAVAHGGPGGFFPVDLASLSANQRGEYDAAATKAVELMNSASNGQTIELVELSSAQSQVVAGTNYDLELSITIDGQPQVCFVYASLATPWLNGGQWSVRSQCSDNPCAGFSASE